MAAPHKEVTPQHPLTRALKDFANFGQLPAVRSIAIGGDAAIADIIRIIDVHIQVPPQRDGNYTSGELKLLASLPDLLDQKNSGYVKTAAQEFRHDVLPAIAGAELQAKEDEILKKMRYFWHRHRQAVGDAVAAVYPERSLAGGRIQRELMLPLHQLLSNFNRELFAGGMSQPRIYAIKNLLNDVLDDADDAHKASFSEVALETLTDMIGVLDAFDSEISPIIEEHRKLAQKCKAPVAAGQPVTDHRKAEEMLTAELKDWLASTPEMGYLNDRQSKESPDGIVHRGVGVIRDHRRGKPYLPEELSTLEQLMQDLHRDSGKPLTLLKSIERIEPLIEANRSPIRDDALKNNLGIYWNNHRKALCDIVSDFPQELKLLQTEIIDRFEAFEKNPRLDIFIRTNPLIHAPEFYPVSRLLNNLHVKMNGAGGQKVQNAQDKLCQAEGDFKPLEPEIAEYMKSRSPAAQARS